MPARNSAPRRHAITTTHAATMPTITTPSHCPHTALRDGTAGPWHHHPANVARRRALERANAQTAAARRRVDTPAERMGDVECAFGWRFVSLVVVAVVAVLAWSTLWPWGVGS
jgi:hypothetical protein